jgi:hypothetical protein
MSDVYEAAIEDLKAAIRGSPKSDADAKALEMLRRIGEQPALAGDQAELFLALRARYAAPQLKGSGHE